MDGKSISIVIDVSMGVDDDDDTGSLLSSIDRRSSSIDRSLIDLISILSGSSCVYPVTWISRACHDTRVGAGVTRVRYRGDM